jgi:CRP/FNR family transcriptional regulator, anaerobic regulatory protein
MPDTIPVQDAWKGEADCRSCKLRDSVLFAGLHEKDFEVIHDPITQVTLSPGEALYRTGDRGTRLFTVRHGLIKLVRYLPDGTQRIVRLIRGSDVIGMEALLDQSYEHDALAMQATEICQLPVQVVRNLSQRNPTLHKELLNRWQRALNDADAWLTELSTGSARHRIARMLLRIVEQVDDQPQCSLFAREDLGAMLGITTETASRTIAEFKRNGLLRELASNRFAVDVEALENMIG